MSNNPLSRRRFLAAVGASAVSGVLSSRATAGQQSLKNDQPVDARDSTKNRPNIMIFMPDELPAAGTADLLCPICTFRSRSRKPFPVSP